MRPEKTTANTERGKQRESIEKKQDIWKKKMLPWSDCVCKVKEPNKESEILKKIFLKLNKNESVNHTEPCSKEKLMQNNQHQDILC